ncbi:hypothetical protein [Natrinema gelatinilyticum]|uniref:hypothetical protein n=1 Tax=Natrinema gelatinilyticum TaxID=2961571 RepID=UPI003CE544A0
MVGYTSLNGPIPEIQLGPGEREATPHERMKLDIQLHLSELLPLNGIPQLERFCVKYPMLFSEENLEHPVFGGFTPEALEELAGTIHSDRPAFAKQFISDMFADPSSAERIDEMYAGTMKTPTSVARRL